MVILLVGIILLAVWLVWRYVNKPKSVDDLLPGKSSTDNSIEYVGKAETIDDAKRMAAAVTGAKAVLYYTASAGDFAKMVYAVKRSDADIPDNANYLYVRLTKQ